MGSDLSKFKAGLSLLQVALPTCFDVVLALC